MNIVAVIISATVSIIAVIISLASFYRTLQKDRLDKQKDSLDSSNNLIRFEGKIDYVVATNNEIKAQVIEHGTLFTNMRERVTKIEGRAEEIDRRVTKIEDREDTK